MAKIPDQLPKESWEAYQAACAYFEMGANRSTAKVAQQYSKTKALMDRWSGKFNWVARAREYDQSMAQDMADKQSAEYRSKLAAYTSDAEKAADSLLKTAVKLIDYMQEALKQSTVIKDEHGREVTIHSFELSSGTLSAATRAVQMALNVKAHLLGVDDLQKELEADSKDYIAPQEDGPR